MIEYGKIPPQNIEIETLLLGELITFPDFMDEVTNILKPESFYKKAHTQIYDVMIEMHSEYQAIDLPLLANKLKKENVLEVIGGAYYLSQLISKVSVSANIIDHAKVIKDKYTKREFIRVAYDLEKLALDDQDTETLIDTAEKSLHSIIDTNSSEIEKVDSITDSLIKELEKIQASKMEISGVPSGIPSLDRITSGWQPSDLILLAARPSMGKTALALQFAKHAATQGFPTLFFTLEMSKAQLVKRLLSSENGISVSQMNRGHFQWNQMEHGISKIHPLPLYIDDTPNISTNELRSKIRKYIHKYDIKIVFIDYIQLAKGDKSRSIEQEIASISIALKTIAKIQNIPIIALSQLSRDVEKRSKAKFPVLSDLRHSGQLEQDADLVLFPTRYKAIGIEYDEDGVDMSSQAKLDLAKHRNGKIDVFNLSVSEDVSNWYDAND